MSRGLGKLERFWLGISLSTDQAATGFKPWTFDEICNLCWDFELTSSTKRSLRRALRSMVLNGTILRLSGHRYSISPAMLQDDDRRKAQVLRQLMGEKIYIIHSAKVEGAPQHDAH
jgi:hypothetical protein